VSNQISAQDKEQAKIGERIKFLRDLLGEFGLDLRGVDPGFSANLKDRPPGGGHGFWGEHISMGNAELRWVEPLLVELRERRRKDASPRPEVRP